MKERRLPSPQRAEMVTKQFEEAATSITLGNPDLDLLADLFAASVLIISQTDSLEVRRSLAHRLTRSRNPEIIRRAEPAFETVIDYFEECGVLCHSRTKKEISIPPMAIDIWCRTATDRNPLNPQGWKETFKTCVTLKPFLSWPELVNTAKVFKGRSATDLRYLTLLTDLLLRMEVTGTPVNIATVIYEIVDRGWQNILLRGRVATCPADDEERSYNEPWMVTRHQLTTQICNTFSRFQENRQAGNLPSFFGTTTVESPRKGQRIKDLCLTAAAAASFDQAIKLTRQQFKELSPERRSLFGHLIGHTNPDTALRRTAICNLLLPQVPLFPTRQS